MILKAGCQKFGYGMSRGRFIHTYSAYLLNFMDECIIVHGISKASGHHFLKFYICPVLYSPPYTCVVTVDIFTGL